MLCFGLSHLLFFCSFVSLLLLLPIYTTLRHSCPFTTSVVHLPIIPLLKLACIPTLQLKNATQLQIAENMLSKLGGISHKKLLRIWNVASGTEDLSFTFMSEKGKWTHGAILKEKWRPWGVAHLVGGLSCKPKGHRFDSGSGHILRLLVQFLAGVHMGSHQSMSLCLSSLPLSKINKHIIGWVFLKSDLKWTPQIIGLMQTKMLRNPNFLVVEM